MTLQTANKKPPLTKSPAEKNSSLSATVKDQTGAGKLRIGDMLRKEGYITKNQLDTALAEQKKTSDRLGRVLVHLGLIEEETVLNVLSRQHGFTAVVISKEPPNQEALKVLPYEIAKKYMAFPLRIASQTKTLQVTMAEPTDTSAVEALQIQIKMGLSVCVSTEKDIIEAYRKHYNISDEEYRTFFPDEETEDELPITQIDDFGALASEAADELEVEASDIDDSEFDEYSFSDAPIIKLVNGILIKAVTDGVSDIHIEPFEKTLQVRYRTDGSLFKSMNLPLSIKNALVSRIKILSNLDITERRVPQDGRIKMRIGRKKVVDFRVSSLPTLFGEGIVLRILDQSNLNVDLTKLGFENATFTTLKRCISKPQGMLLVTGPTGSGKTVTLYSILNSLNKEDIKILTAEDPVEFNFKGINQVNVQTDVGMTFAAALKAFLRQDPDIIMVGEIRDMETAEIAIKAAMTGHLVLSTLHTNDSPSTIGRLVEIGIPPYMLASSVSMVLSQRLARRLCFKCKAPEENLDRNMLLSIGVNEDEVDEFKAFRARGCSFCNAGGHKGRVGLFELMENTEEVSKAISAELPEDQLRKIAIQEGMTPLRDAGLLKVKQGLMSIKEVLKKTVITKESLPAYLVNPDVEKYENGDIIIREGNKDIDFYQLVQGELNVVKGGKKIAEIVQPGVYFGEMSAISGEVRSATIISKGRTNIKRFPGDKVFEIIEKHPDVTKHLFKSIVGRLHQSDKIIINLASQRPAQQK